MSPDPAAEPSAFAAADHQLDTSGLVCPEPLMVLRNRMRDLAPGQTLAVLATDPAAQRDFAQYCRFVHHELLLADGADGLWRFVIRKGAGR